MSGQDDDTQQQELLMFGDDGEPVQEMPDYLTVPGMQIWIYSEEAWWPAKIITPESVNMGSSADFPREFLFVRFYDGVGEDGAGSVTSFTYSPHVVCPFESASEKNITGDPALSEAIKRAIADEPNSLRHVSAEIPVHEGEGGYRSVEYGASSKLEKAAGRRRKRDEDNDDKKKGGDSAKDSDGDDDRKSKREKKSKKEKKKEAAAAATKKKSQPAESKASQIAQRGRKAGAASGAAAATEAQKQQAADRQNMWSDREFFDAKNKVEEAVRNNSITELRRQLLALARVKPSLQQLKSTKVGVAVSSVLERPNLKALQPIAATIIHYWMQELPESTKDALRRYAEIGGLATVMPPAGAAGYATAASVAASAAGVASAAAAAAAASSANDASSSSVAATATNSTSFSEPSTRFGKMLLKAFQNLDCKGANTPARVNAFLHSIETSASIKDNTVLMSSLLTQCYKDGHAELRSSLLTGAVSLSEFAAMGAEQLLTADERQAEAEAMQALEHRAAEGKKERSGNTLFECPECGARNSTQYEIQIRSCDEPATVFIECLDCEHNWREG